MALGNGGFTPNSGSTDNNKKNFDPTVYCPVLLKNPEAQSDPSELSFAYWKNLLKISISPKMERRDTDRFDQYDHNNNAVIYLNSIKARIFAKEIRNMIENPGTINSAGVNSGTSGLITFSTGAEFGIDGYVLVIRKLDENGTVISSYAYQFNGTFYNSIRNFNESNLKFDKQLFPMIEVEWFIDLLEKYSEAQNYAAAYAVTDSLKYDFSRLNTKVESIMSNLGIQVPQKNRSNNGGGRSFFDASKEGSKNEAYSNAGYGSSSSSTSIDDVAAELE